MLTTVTELPEYIRRADELLNEAERKSVIDYLAVHPRAGEIMEGTGGASVSFVGHEATRGKAVVFELFIITMTIVFPSIFLPFLEKMKNRILQNLNVLSLPSSLACLFNLH